MVVKRHCLSHVVCTFTSSFMSLHPVGTYLLRTLPVLQMLFLIMLLFHLYLCILQTWSFMHICINLLNTLYDSWLLRPPCLQYWVLLIALCLQGVKHTLSLTHQPQMWWPLVSAGFPQEKHTSFLRTLLTSCICMHCKHYDLHCLHFVLLSAGCNFVLLYWSLHVWWYLALLATMALSIPFPSSSLSNWIGNCPSSLEPI